MVAVKSNCGISFCHTTKKKIFTLLWKAHCLKLQAQPNRQNKCCDVCSFKLPKHFAYIVWLGLGTKNPLGLGKIRFWLKIPWFCHRKHNKFFSHAPKISSVFTLTNIKTQYSNTCLLPLASPPPHNMKVSSCRCNMVYMTWYQFHWFAETWDWADQQQRFDWTLDCFLCPGIMKWFQDSAFSIVSLGKWQCECLKSKVYLHICYT